MTSCEELVTEC